MNKEPVEKYYKKRAEMLMDVLHDKGFLAEDCALKSIRELTKFIAWYLQTECRSAVTCARLCKEIKGE